MRQLDDIKDFIDSVLNVLSATLSVEAAVINDKFKLVTCTPHYLEEKGSEIHQLFIEKVFELGDMIVANPGCMEYCQGCRFQDDCPAAIELLSPITVNNINVGVLSISLFNTKQPDCIDDNIDVYRNALLESSKLISQLLLNSKGKKSDKVASQTMDVYDGTKYKLNAIVGDNLRMKELKQRIAKIASSPSAVILTGETGTGKELFARAIHYSSNRQHKPFIPLNCAAIPETLLESELFGYEEGAFSGAKRKGKSGLFELANGGTLFLDEIGDMPLHLQAKLLRVLQDHHIRRVGGSKFIHLDVRIITATNQHIEKLIDEGQFRSDLYYRLNIININIPPLRDRKTDIESLADHFLKKYSFSFQKDYKGFHQDTLSLLKNYNWPGNVRELENTVEYMINIEDGDYLTPDSLPDKFRSLSAHSPQSLQDKVDQFERNIILEALDKFGTDTKGKEQAAQELNIGLRTLYRKTEKLGIK